MQEQLIAPCGMNCSLCVSYRFMANDLNRHGFHRRYCPGCIPRGKHCTFMASSCERVGKGRVRFCVECPDYPCKRLKSLDKRYREKYYMSMIENLETIKTNGMASFLQSQQEKWRCPKCGGVVCCHNGLCLTCDIEKLKKDKTLRKSDDKPFESINKHILEYHRQLQKGSIQTAYRGILGFMAALKTQLQQAHPEFVIGALYQGTMDMTYFAFTPPVLHKQKLKIAVVFLHEPLRFEVWLCAANRTVLSHIREKLAGAATGEAVLSKPGPGVDSALEQIIAEQPNFDDTKELSAKIKAKTLDFIGNVTAMLGL